MVKLQAKQASQLEEQLHVQESLTIESHNCLQDTKELASLLLKLTDKVTANVTLSDKSWIKLVSAGAKLFLAFGCYVGICYFGQDYILSCFLCPNARTNIVQFQSVQKVQYSNSQIKGVPKNLEQQP